MKRVIGGIAAIVALAATTMVAGTASAQADDRVTFLHGVPGVPVDVSVDGTVTFPNVQPQQTEDLNQFRGQTLNDVVLLGAGTQDVLAGPVSIPVPATGSWNIVAHLDASGAVVITSFENNVSPTANASEGRFTMRHAAQADAVDLVIGDQRPISGLAPGTQREIELPAGNVSNAQLAPAGEAPIADLPTLPVDAGTNLIVYVVGSSSSGGIAFYTQTAQIATADVTTTTDPNATTTTTDPNATTTTTTTTVADSTTTTEAVPTAVNTGSPLGSSVNTALVVVALGGVLVAGTALIARRRVAS